MTAQTGEANGTSTALSRASIDGAALRHDFPIFRNAVVNGRPLTFLDSAASSQKPQCVIDALRDFYETSNANIHRGVYRLSELATEQYEGARRRVARFINAGSPRECVFVRGTTEGLNLVASSWGRANLGPGDLIVYTETEHHSNIVPWQLIAEQTGARIAWVPMTPDGLLDREAFTALMAQGPKLLALAHVSNALGTVNPVKELIAEAHAAGAVVVLDGAQSVPHMPVDVQDLDCDFLAFSGHKMLGPMGSGVLYGKRRLLDAMPPYQGGGSMIRKVELTHTTWADVPTKFEAGTPSIGDAIALTAALDYLETLGMDAVWEHERAVGAYAVERLSEVPGLTIYGPTEMDHRSGVLSFGLGDIHPHDVATLLDEQNIAVRAGHHCAQPVMRALDVMATTRASFYLYNDRDDVDRLVEGLHHAIRTMTGGGHWPGFEPQAVSRSEAARIGQTAQ